VIEGPAVIQQFESTVVIPPGRSLTVDRHGILMAAIDDAGGRPA
jgi:N-methylhydantoinase A/oxoprolinase/acetone carboxylase beta subunit